MAGVDLAFEEFGRQDDLPLIILHGFFASSRNWRSVAEKLSAEFHVYALDLRNHGNSPHHPLMDYPAMAADLLLFLDNHRLKSASLLGHSMGGKVAMWFALNYPGYVHKLIVVDIAPVSYPHSFDELILALKELPLGEISNRKQAEMRLASAIPALSYRQFLLQNLVLKNSAYCWRIDLDIFYRMAPNIIAFPDASHLAPFTGEALFIAGEDSDYIKPDDIAGLFPQATLKVIAKAGHWLHVQQPEVFIALVEKFLQHE
ncbi:Alpha/beta hydrolase fold protein [Candidatus Methylobacter favarea]|uniref:Alpha/beta hydrolase fold protein n=1 Tax=Candidatus Methylobacter favarea TaxID=2707345 RepID=A0A8S0XLT9_9GAMM|nr:alpha/beta fold hydrolase [Candidatus Methylobacter favarea]CAA9892982.1 Alpha/beta hydrolase fold protein [Candidatus Methylobacter favarea]